ncbi:hypothetical protein GCM10010954_25440 [Halobacillus andaensis]|uniref:Uncharacterized protein n=1 Tax=Halobacillus andaensis TaxID=1176239 RepID=A0A917EYM4_HALAA|nr:hypothetical protein [Halobacillus andaensis]MBP2005869.1 hypothetical protein [Halobacillus andaensis]GGF25443.1 hypothetical protein GCM10010954_25440 [Halobacillus andaensis]
MIVQPALALRILSFVIAILVFWFISTRKRGDKKQIVEAFISNLTTWVLFFIGVKVITKWEILLDHPLAVLAYPSGTLEFYIASLLTMLWLIRKSSSSRSFLYEHVQLVAYSLFIFAFMSVIVLGEQGLFHLLFPFLFSILITLVRAPLVMIICVSLISGMAGLVGQTPEIMGYRMDGWFYFGIAGIAALLFFNEKRRGRL